MDNVEATQVLATELAECRRRSYADLVAMVEEPKRTVEVVAPSGIRYYLDVLVHWDGESGGNVRVTVTIDNGGARAFVPLSEDFIKAPDGSFVDEEA